MPVLSYVKNNDFHHCLAEQIATIWDQAQQQTSGIIQRVLWFLATMPPHLIHCLKIREQNGYWLRSNFSMAVPKGNTEVKFCAMLRVTLVPPIMTTLSGHFQRFSSLKWYSIQMYCHFNSYFPCNSIDFFMSLKPVHDIIYYLSYLRHRCIVQYDINFVYNILWRVREVWNWFISHE